MIAAHVVGRDAGEPAGDARADVAALGAEALVAETAHQLGERGGGRPISQPGERSGRKAEAGQGGRQDVEGLGRSPPCAEDR